MRKVAGYSGLLAPVTFTVGWIVGDAVQRAAFTPSRDDISYLGALTAKSPWLYNQLGANVSGLLIVVLACGLWLELNPSRVGRLGAGLLGLTGAGTFLDGMFRLDCQSIDAGCRNVSWHAHAHKIESGATVAFTFAAIIVLALAFRRVARRRNALLAVIPGVLIANVAFSAIGAGAAVRAGTVVIFLAFGALGVRLLRAS